MSGDPTTLHGARPSAPRPAGAAGVGRTAVRTAGLGPAQGSLPGVHRVDLRIEVDTVVGLLARALGTSLLVAAVLAAVAVVGATTSYRRIDR